MGGDATARVCDETDLNITGCALLHPALSDDLYGGDYAKNMKHPSIWFTGSADDTVRLEQF